MVPTTCPTPACTGKLLTDNMTADEERAQQPDLPCAAYRCPVCRARVVVDAKGRPAAAMAPPATGT